MFGNCGNSVKSLSMACVIWMIEFSVHDVGGKVVPFYFFVNELSGTSRHKTMASTQIYCNLQRCCTEYQGGPSYL